MISLEGIISCGVFSWKFFLPGGSPSYDRSLPSESRVLCEETAPFEDLFLPLNTFGFGGSPDPPRTDSGHSTFPDLHGGIWFLVVFFHLEAWDNEELFSSETKFSFSRSRPLWPSGTFECVISGPCFSQGSLGIVGHPHSTSSFQVSRILSPFLSS